MARLAGIVGAVAIFVLGTGGYARTKVREAPVDASKGVKLASRIPCDGATNPHDYVSLTPTFSSGTLERSFRVQVFEKDYCKRMDLGFKCLQAGHDLWRQEWTVDSLNPQNDTIGLESCVHETLLDKEPSKEAPQILLTGWYREDAKSPWKQASLQKVSSRWETYEFTDPAGGTARLELDRR